MSDELVAGDGGGALKVGQMRALVLGKWARNLKPGDHVQRSRAPCGCKWVRVNGRIVWHRDCQRHAAQLRRHAA